MPSTGSPCSPPSLAPLPSLPPYCRDPLTSSFLTGTTISIQVILWGAASPGHLNFLPGPARKETNKQNLKKRNHFPYTSQLPCWRQASKARTEKHSHLLNLAFWEQELGVPSYDPKVHQKVCLRPTAQLSCKNDSIARSRREDDE